MILEKPIRSKSQVVILSDIVHKYLKVLQCMEMILVLGARDLEMLSN